MTAKIIDEHKTLDGTSYRIQFENGLKLWFDTWRSDNEVTGDWNKYIFHLNNPDDVIERDFQNNSDNFEIAINLTTDLTT